MLEKKYPGYQTILAELYRLNLNFVAETSISLNPDALICKLKSDLKDLVFGKISAFSTKFLPQDFDAEKLWTEIEAKLDQESTSAEQEIKDLENAANLNPMFSRSAN